MGEKEIIEKIIIYCLTKEVEMRKKQSLINVMKKYYNKFYKINKREWNE
jgi:hypothetical protein